MAEIIQLTLESFVVSFSQNKLADSLSRFLKGSGVLINEHADENKHAEAVDLNTYACGVYSVLIFITRPANHQGSYCNQSRAGWNAVRIVDDVSSRSKGQVLGIAERLETSGRRLSREALIAAIVPFCGTYAREPPHRQYRADASHSCRSPFGGGISFVINVKLSERLKRCK